MPAVLPDKSNGRESLWPEFREAFPYIPSALSELNMANEKIVIAAGLCDGCAACIEVCPMDCLKMEEGKAILKREDDCLVCLTCEAECRAGAISVSS